MSTMSKKNLIGDINNAQVREGMHNLIASVIGEAIKPDHTYRLANGRMNRPEERGGETATWLNTNSGKYWLKLADLTGVINSEAITKLAQNNYKDKVGRYIEGELA